GMTELASQVYDQVSPREDSAGDQLARDAAPLRFKKPPPWMRTLLFDPRRARRDESLFITRPNEIGLLRHFDLANVERPLAIQTEDLGEWVAENGNGSTEAAAPDGGFEVLGRASSAEPKGCSISLEEFYRPHADGLPV